MYALAAPNRQWPIIGAIAAILAAALLTSLAQAQVLELKEKPKARFERNKEDIDVVKEAVKGSRDAAQDTSRVLERAEQTGVGAFRVADVRSPDLGLWFDRSVRDGLV